MVEWYYPYLSILLIFYMKDRIIKVFYYVPESGIKEREKLYTQGLYRGELAYGALHLRNFNILPIDLFPLKEWQSKLWRILYAFYLIFKSRSYDAIYTPYFNGLEYAIKLRGLGLFSPKILIWHHNPIEKVGGNFWAEMKQKLFYRGCDALFFFSEEIKKESLYSGVDIIHKSYVLKWGPDMFFYNRIRLPYDTRGGIIMSGRDSRDFATLFDVAKRLPNHHFTVVPPDVETASLFTSLQNVKIKNFSSSYEGYYQLACETAKSSLVLILTKPIAGRNLPSGLTSICEATGLGKPCIITDNKYFDSSLRQSSFAKYVKVCDVDNICYNIEFLFSHHDVLRDMAEAALNYAKQNDIAKMSQHLSQIIKMMV